MPSLPKMKNFPVVHRLHLLVTLEYSLARAIIFQVTINLESFRDHTKMEFTVTWTHLDTTGYQNGTYHFLKVFLCFEPLWCLLHVFLSPPQYPVTLVLCMNHAICRYMLTVGLQYKFKQINEFSAGIPVITYAQILSLLLSHVLSCSNYASLVID